MAITWTLGKRLRRLIDEFAKFAFVGIAGVFITNAVSGLLYLHLGVGPVASTTIATVVAAIATYLGNRYWSFRARGRTGLVREIIIFAVLNGVGLLLQDSVVAANFYLLRLGQDKLAAFAALNSGIALATLFRFWSYRQFVWGASPARAAGSAGKSSASPPCGRDGGSRWNGTLVTTTPGSGCNARRSRRARWSCRTWCHQCLTTISGTTTVSVRSGRSRYNDQK